MYITNRPDVALLAERCTVDRIWIDLEIIGKEKRQSKINSVKSNHSIKDVSVIRNVIHSAELLVRVNPLYDGTKQEINEVIARGADIVMLPMYHTIDEAKRFVDMVNGKAKTILLLETIAAEVNIEQTVALSGADEIHIGLNDLHIEYKMKFMFELLANGKVDEICKKIKPYNIPYGFGGIADLDEGGLLPGRIIIAEHYRIGSSRAILSRSFYDASLENDNDKMESVFSDGLNKIRAYEKTIAAAPPSFFKNNHNDLKEKVNKIVQNNVSVQQVRRGL